MKTQPSDPNEEPFPLDDSTDRLWDVLGNARNTEPAPNFVQNVVREARLSADQASGSFVRRWFASLAENFQRPAFALTATAAAAVVIALVVAISQPGNEADKSLAGDETGITPDPVTNPAPAPSPSVEAPAASYTVSDQLDDIDYLGDLVAVTDPAALNDEMLADLLY